jgi:hypothetical protein
LRWTRTVISTRRHYPRPQPPIGRLINDLLRRSGCHTVYAADAFLVDDQTQVDDNAIIARCAEAGLAWVTADERARYHHAPSLQGHPIDALFVHRPNDGMNMRWASALLSLSGGSYPPAQQVGHP